MKSSKIQTLRTTVNFLPACLTERMGQNAPDELQFIGPISFLSQNLTCFFCSIDTPGKAILKTYDTIGQLRDKGVTIISGFHSPMEKECLRILLRGNQPIIICPARSLSKMRITVECRDAFNSGRILFISPFIEKPHRATKESAMYRNGFVAALSSAAFIPHVSPNGEASRIANLLRNWEIPFLC